MESSKKKKEVKLEVKGEGSIVTELIGTKEYFLQNSDS